MKKIAILLGLAVFLTVSCVEKDVEREQESCISNVSVTPCRQSELRSSNPASKVDVEFTNKGVQITYHNFEVTCDFTTVDVTHTFVNGVLRITQKGSPNQADCVCYSDVSYTINGLLKNEVNVIFINGRQVYCYNSTGNEEEYVVTLSTLDSKGGEGCFQLRRPDENTVNSEIISLFAWTETGILQVRRNTFDFDLSSIPSGSVIDKALFCLYYDRTSELIPLLHGYYSEGENDFYIQRIISPWHQNTVTWNTQPTTTTQNQVLVPKVASPDPDFPTIDVTNLVRDMMNDKDGSYGFLIKFQVEQPYKVILFASSKHPDKSIRPKLVVHYKKKK